jgi:hypothetical protein
MQPAVEERVMGIVEFLDGRLNEAQDIAERNCDGNGLCDGFPDYRTYFNDDTNAADDYIAHFNPAYVLAGISATRAIVALHQPEEVEYLDGDGQDRMSTDCTTCDTGGCANTWPCDTLKLLAAPYDQHPDYDEAWRIDA